MTYEPLAKAGGFSFSAYRGPPMSALAHAVALIKRWEGCRLEAYPDPASGGEPWTIGWGATGPGIKKGVRWTQAQADDRLALDVERFMRGVRESLARAPAEPFSVHVRYANRFAALSTEHPGAAAAMPRHDEVAARFGA